MIHHNAELFYDIYNTINEHNRRQIHYLPSILANYFDINYIMINHDFYAITF